MQSFLIFPRYYSILSLRIGSRQTNLPSQLNKNEFKRELHHLSGLKTNCTEQSVSLPKTNCIHLLGLLEQQRPKGILVLDNFPFPIQASTVLFLYVTHLPQEPTTHLWSHFTLCTSFSPALLTAFAGAGSSASLALARKSLTASREEQEMHQKVF